MPLISFAFIYGANEDLHILPSSEDITSLSQLYNVSAFENTLFCFEAHKWISSVHVPLLDVLAAVAYLGHYTTFIVYPLYLLYRGQAIMILDFLHLVGWVMWAHYLVWLFLPTAPPWLYDVTSHQPSNTPLPSFDVLRPEGCAFARLDTIMENSFFFDMFQENPVPFASFPSAHVGLTVCLLITAPSDVIIFAIWSVWMSWATMYSCHHYLSDVLGTVILVTTVKQIISFIKRDNQSKFKDCIV